MKHHEATGPLASGKANRNGMSGEKPATALEPTLGGFGLYIHWPFCVSKCPYCDFNSHVADTVDQLAWQKALLRELHYYGSITKGRCLSSVFFGGGTPNDNSMAISNDGYIKGSFHTQHALQSN